MRKRLEILVWAIRDAPRAHVARPLKWRRPRGSGQRLSGRKHPVERDGPEQLGHHGAANPEVQVLGGLPSSPSEDAGIADVQAAAEPHRSVDHEELPVVAQVDVGVGDREQTLQKFGHRHPARFATQPRWAAGYSGRRHRQSVLGLGPRGPPRVRERQRTGRRPGRDRKCRWRGRRSAARCRWRRAWPGRLRPRSSGGRACCPTREAPG